MVTRNSLPQNYITQQDILFESFETVGDWTGDASTTLSADSVNVKTGLNSLKLTTVNAGGTASAIKTIASTNMKLKKLYYMWVYCHDSPANYNAIHLQFSSTTNFSRYMYSSYTALKKGWNLLALHRDKFTAQGGESWDNPMVRMRVRVMASTGNTASASFDAIYADRTSVPKVVITFDDGRSMSYDTAYTYMMNKGLKGTLYMITNYLGTGGSYLTKAQLDTLYSLGWAVANHTTDHTVLTGLSTQAEVEQKIGDAKDALINGGYPRAARHVAYPGGAFNDTVLAAMQNLGMKTGRIVQSRDQTAPIDQQYVLNTYNIKMSISLATAQSYIDDVISRNSTAILVFHDIQASPSSDGWTPSNFQALIDYILAKKVDVVTIDEWYEGLINPRYRIVL